MNRQESYEKNLSVAFDTPKIIGLTGGIGSGKSTVAQILREEDYIVLDADIISRKIVEPGSRGLEELVEHFSKDILNPDGTLHRSKLRNIIMNCEEDRKKVNEITHPKIAIEMVREVKKYAAKGYQWVIYEAALLVETGMSQRLDGLILVHVPEEVQRERLALRDSMTHEEADMMLGIQMRLAEKLQAANYLLDNSGTLEQTKSKTLELARQLVEDYGPQKT